MSLSLARRLSNRHVCLLFRRTSGATFHQRSRAFVPSIPPVSSSQGLFSPSRYFASSPIIQKDDDTEQSAATASIPIALEHKDILQQMKRKSLELLDLRVHPQGSYTPSHIATAKDILDFFRRDKVTESDVVNMSIALIERLVEEREISKDGSGKWICQPTFIHPILRLWKEASKERRNVLAPKDLLEKLQRLSRIHADFRYDIVTFNIVMDVVMKQAHPKWAPRVAEGLLELLRKEALQTQNSMLHPNEFTYNNLLQAWAVSGLPETPIKMDIILQTMRREGIVPTAVTYNILLRYWADKGVLNRMEAILETMKNEGLGPSRMSLSPAIYGYAKAGKTAKAEEMLDQLTALIPKDENEASIIRVMIAQSSQAILLAYRSMLDYENSNPAQKERVVRSADKLYQKMSQNKRLSKDDHERLTNTMLSVFARARKYEQVERLFFINRYRLGTVSHNVLIKSFGEADMADKAATVLATIMHEESRVKPNLQTFNTLLNAWADSSKPDAFDQALAILGRMCYSTECTKLGIRPDAITFNSILKCLAKSNVEDTWKRAVDLLDEMVRRYRARDRNAKPNQITFNLVIKMCLQAGNTEMVEALIKRMKDSHISPDVRTYNEMLNYLSTTGTLDAAERSEQLLTDMEQQKTKPTTISYNIVMHTWSKSGDSESGEHMWRLYERMKKENVEPSVATFNTLITFFSKSTEQVELERAECLLQCMEESKRPDLQPDYRQYSPVIKGWLHSGNVENATRILVRFIKNKHAKTKPNVATIDMVMQGWIKKGNLEQATLLVEQMQGLKESNFLPKGPDSTAYNSLLAAWEKSDHPEKERMMDKLKERLSGLNSATSS